MKKPTLVSTATPATGSTFVGWSGCTPAAANPRQCTVALSAARVAIATFTRPVLTVTKAGSGAGLITGTGISCGVDCTEPYNLTNPPLTVTLTAAPATGSTFVGWTGCTPLANPRQCTVAMNAAKTVKATFNTTTAGTYALTLYKVGMGSGTVTSNPVGINCGTACVANFTSGRTVTLTATPATGSTLRRLDRLHPRRGQPQAMYGRAECRPHRYRQLRPASPHRDQERQRYGDQ
jgi:hypothetical protein